GMGRGWTSILLASEDGEDGGCSQRVPTDRARVERPATLGVFGLQAAGPSPGARLPAKPAARRALASLAHRLAGIAFPSPAACRRRAGGLVSHGRSPRRDSAWQGITAERC